MTKVKYTAHNIELHKGVKYNLRKYSSFRVPALSRDISRNICIRIPIPILIYLVNTQLKEYSRVWNRRGHKFIKKLTFFQRLCSY